MKTIPICAALTSLFGLAGCAESPTGDGAVPPPPAFEPPAAGEHQALPEPSVELAEARTAVTAANGECGSRSSEFRQVVAPCFEQQNLCGAVLSVTFDERGDAKQVEFLNRIAAGPRAAAAAQILACVTQSFGKLGSPCSKSTSIHYQQSCTVN